MAFYQDLENWLSSSVKISNNNSQKPFSKERISYSGSLTDTAALHLSELASALTTIEADRSRLLHQITELNTQLRRLVDQIESDASIQKKLPGIEAKLQSISEEARSNHSSKIDIIKNLIPKFDNIIIVGGMANNIIKFMGNNIGKSLHEEGSDLSLIHI